MFCIVGLGNPGSQYSQTRHNAGFLVVDRLLEKTGGKLKSDFQSLYTKVDLESNQLLLVKPQTFMNLSGQAVKAIAGYFKVEPDKLLVIYDDMDLPVGALRFRTSGSAGGHRGLTSILSLLKTKEIARLRVGIGRPPAGVAVPDYVLTPFQSGERSTIDATIAKAVEAAMAFINLGADYTMNHFNIIPKNSTDNIYQK